MFVYNNASSVHWKKQNSSFKILYFQAKKDEKDISEYQFTHEETVSAIDRITLDSLMNHLNDEEREVVVLHSSGFRHREIAQMTGLSLSGVLSKYNRAMKKLKERYEKGMKNE